ncbi:hypothetical protein AXG93_4295s1070 [Marchantia polymorpha subsp. ruderalis]|uniref:Uncharacterized protein n=1 Tax=Marchantia polymorpha subsp. ruderalis TaxID=1480154 RepID=A0A176WBX9_MARPO|nr:hypothetical protein AXG93_4295s1070 [Marchantia polymorpha subsp. ruderalis]
MGPIVLWRMAASLRLHGFANPAQLVSVYEVPNGGASSWRLESSSSASLGTIFRNGKRPMAHSESMYTDSESALFMQPSARGVG